MYENIGLVLEGGGMRGVFTAGVLDCFLDNGIIFNYVVGVSAGASNGLSYASRQRGRAHFCNIDIMRTRPYVGFKYMFSQHCAMDYEYMFSELPKVVYPYDWNAYRKCGKFILVATNCLTGKPQYFENPDTFESLLQVCRASCSMPYVSTIVNIGGVPYLDGGISDAVPIRRAIADGYKKNVVVLTRNQGYRKREKFPSAMSFIYSKYPKLRECLAHKNDDYNSTMDCLEDLEKRGDVVVIRPLRKLKINRLESNPDRLEELYQEGYRCAQVCLNSGELQRLFESDYESKSESESKQV